MNFLAPWFLLGALAVALPLLFHLIRRASRQRTVFSSLLFLQPTPPRLSRRSRLEHWLLLLLRCAVVCMLAAGFARPFLKQPPSEAVPAAPAHRLLVLVDASASMQRPDLWNDVRVQVATLLRACGPADQVALFTFDRGTRPILTFEEWRSTPAGERAEVALHKLGETGPGWSSTRLGDALIAAAEAMADPGGDNGAYRGEIVLVTDLQEGSRLDGLQGYEWPKGLAVSIRAVQPRQAGNAAIQLAAETDSTVGGTAGLRVRVSNTTDSRREQFRVRWEQAGGASVPPVEVYVPAGQSRVLSLPIESPGMPGQVVLEGDAEEFDNSLFVVPPATARFTVLYLGSDAKGDAKAPRFFLERAFQETRRQAVHVVARGPGVPLPVEELEGATLLVVSSPLSPENARSVRQSVLSGKNALLLLGAADEAAGLARLLDLDRVPATESRGDGYAMLAEIDFRHPLFAPFADPRFNDFSKIRFWRHRRIEAAAIPQARAVAAFDNGDPALLEVPVGKGRVLVLTSGWQPEESQLALSTKFVPMLYAWLESSGGVTPASAQYRVDDLVPLPPGEPATLLRRLRKPDGAELTLAPGQTNFTETSMPGLYTVDAAAGPRRFAVNLDGVESRTAPMAADDLERLGVPVARRAAMAQPERKTRWHNAELENRQKLWRWVLFGVLGVLALETWLAGWTSRNEKLI